MPQYVITAPDGRKFRVSGEGTKDEALAHFQSQYGSQKQPEPEKYSATGSFGENTLAGIGKAFSDVGRGARQVSTELGNAVGLGRIMPASFGDQEVERQRQEVDETQQRDAQLMASGGGKVGNLAGNMALAVPTAAIPGANTVTGAGVVGAGLGMLQPATSGTERAINTGIGAGLGAGGQYVGGRVAQWAGNRLAQRQAQAAERQAQNAVRDETIEDALEHGYVVPPSTTNPNALNRTMESVAGKAATQSAAAERNQLVTNSLVREDLGMAADAPLTRHTLQQVRQREGQVYQAVRQSGEITSDNRYMEDLLELIDDNQAITQNFPDAEPATDEAVHRLANALARDRFTADAAVDMVQRLRAQAQEGFRSLHANPNPAARQLAQARWDGAGALEEMIERHLQTVGAAELAGQFRHARMIIAKSHSAEQALNEGTGNVIARRLVQQMGRGRPMTQGFGTIARFASAAPKAMAEPTQSGGVSALSAALAAGGAGLGSPALLAMPVARYLTRRGLLTPAAQRRIALSNYQPGRAGTSALRGMQGLGQVAAPLSIAGYATEQ